MPRKKHKPEEIVAKLRQVDVAWPAPIRWPGSNLMHGGLGGHG
jgi:hypothetical protein